VEAFRPGVMKRLGLGADELRQHNPRLIYCSISGFGQSTDASARPAYAPVVHASSGYYMAMAEAQEGPLMPPNSSVPMADMLTAIFAAMAIQTALLQRQGTGVGTTIDVNLMDSVMSVMAFEFQAAQFPTTHARPHYKPLRALDGHLLVTPINARNFRNLCTATGHPEWIDDPLLATDAARFKNWSEYMRRIEAWTCVRTASECEAILLAHGVPCSPYRRIEEAMRDPQFEQRHSFSRVSDAAGEFLTTNLPFSLAGHRPSASGKVGSIGADTAAVLKDMLGLSDDQIAVLARTGAAICP
jgi:crotonobetainyl-CoA:carnitine CoA-transferase CaiB-like acyl-CoA transferase